MKIYIIIGIITIILGVTVFVLYRVKKLKPVIAFLVNLLKQYGEQIINKVKLAILLNTFRAYVLSKTKNPIWKFLIELFWPEIDLIDTAFKISFTNNKSEAINSIPDLVISKTVDDILNNTKYTNDFATSTNLKMTEKDRGYLEAYLEGKSSDGIPRCKKCGGIIKPDVVLYEEGLDSATIQGAVNAISQADMLIIGGTSLVVYPAAGFIDYFNGKYLAVINKSETGRAVRSNLTISAPIGEVMEKIFV